MHAVVNNNIFTFQINNYLCEGTSKGTSWRHNSWTITKVSWLVFCVMKRCKCISHLLNWFETRILLENHATSTDENTTEDCSRVWSNELPSIRWHGWNPVNWAHIFPWASSASNCVISKNATVLFNFIRQTKDVWKISKKIQVRLWYK